MKFLFGIILLFLQQCLYFGQISICDPDNPLFPCPSGQFCVSGTCQTVSECAPGAEIFQCSSGEICVSGKCQAGTPDDDVTERTIRNITALEGSDVQLRLRGENETGDIAFWSVRWLKDHALLANHSILADLSPTYHNTLCQDGRVFCLINARGRLNIRTGDLTIGGVTVADDGSYFSEFTALDLSQGGIQNSLSGNKYHLVVYVLPTVTIQLPNVRDVTFGGDVTVTCAADRIKPRPLEVYWEVGGRRVVGGAVTSEPDGQGVYRSTTTYTFSARPEEVNHVIKCVVVPVYGDAIEAQESFTLGYAPVGKPSVQASTLQQYTGEQVTLTCRRPADDGNPDCAAWAWVRYGVGGAVGGAQVYAFNMDASRAGRYACRCGNVHGDSATSDYVQINHLGDRPILPPNTPPSGRPSITFLSTTEPSGVRISLTCNRPVNSGSPPCSSFTWAQLQGNLNNPPSTQVYVFTLELGHVVSFTCTCGNPHGTSEPSLPATINVRPVEEATTSVDPVTTTTTTIATTVSEETTFNGELNGVAPPYFPPVLEASSTDLHQGDTVTLTCRGDVTRCRIYIWVKDGQVMVQESTARVYQFTMSEEKAGNYSCGCGIQTGEYLGSDVIEVRYLGRNPDKKNDNIPLIVGISVGGFVFTLFIVITVVACQRYSVSLKARSTTRSNRSTTGYSNQGAVVYQSGEASAKILPNPYMSSVPLSDGGYETPYRSEPYYHEAMPVYERPYGGNTTRSGVYQEVGGSIGARSMGAGSQGSDYQGYVGMIPHPPPPQSTTSSLYADIQPVSMNPGP